jgi:hypothetical protein
MGISRNAVIVSLIPTWRRAIIQMPILENINAPNQYEPGKTNVHAGVKNRKKLAIFLCIA